MAQQPKTKPKPKKRKSATTDTEQSERFKEIARELGVDESGKRFEKAIRQVLKPPRS